MEQPWKNRGRRQRPLVACREILLPNEFASYHAHLPIALPRLSEYVLLVFLFKEFE